MEYLFPTPTRSIVEKKPANRLVRYCLLGLILTSVAVMIFRFVQFGIESGCVYLIMVWFAYASWASLYFCNILMFIIGNIIYLIILLINHPEAAELG